MKAEQEIEALKAHIQHLQDIIQTYEKLADSVRKSYVVDSSIYDEPLNPNEYLAIDRSDYANMIDMISQVDLWKPWQQTVQRRIAGS